MVCTVWCYVSSSLHWSSLRRTTSGMGRTTSWLLWAKMTSPTPNQQHYRYTYSFCGTHTYTQSQLHTITPTHTHTHTHPQIWLFGYELADTLAMFCADEIHILSSKKKIEFLRPLEPALAKREDLPDLKLLVRNKVTQPPRH